MPPISILYFNILTFICKVTNIPFKDIEEVGWLPLRYSTSNESTIHAKVQMVKVKTM